MSKYRFDIEPKEILGAFVGGDVLDAPFHK